MLVIEFCNGSEIKIPALKYDNEDKTVEDAIISAVKVLNVRPVSVPLFGLLIKKDKNYLASSQKLSDLPNEVS